MIARAPLNLITDVAGLRVGNARDDTIKTGVTVLTADAPFTASVSVMGGAPGTRETDLLAPDRTVQQVDAIVLSGGSAFGLDAAQGVSDGLRAAGRGFAVHGMTVPIVPAAIILDLANGGAKDWATSPYPALGRTALEAASEVFALGSEGAGTGAMIADLKGGSRLRLRHVERLHGRRSCRRQPGGAGHGGRWPAFPRRPFRVRR
jgi:L-aminopeptidase/D-esterase-like protein